MRNEALNVTVLMEKIKKSKKKRKKSRKLKKEFRKSLKSHRQTAANSHFFSNISDFPILHSSTLLILIHLYS